MSGRVSRCSVRKQTGGTVGDGPRRLGRDGYIHTLGKITETVKNEVRKRFFSIPLQVPEPRRKIAMVPRSGALLRETRSRYHWGWGAAETRLITQRALASFIA